VSGRIDPSNTSPLEEELSKVIPSSKARVVLNMKNLHFISSSGLRVLKLLSAKAYDAFLYTV
jgi:anti-sigma B factor antagonist